MVSDTNSLEPAFDHTEQLCKDIGSIGLYPYAHTDCQTLEAHQFPKSSGYPEDAATGIAAADLSLVCSQMALFNPPQRLLQWVTDRLRKSLEKS